MPVGVITDSVASIPPDLVRENGLEVVSLYVNDGETNQLDLEMDVPAFYRRLADMGTLPTSSQPSVESLMEAFRRVVANGSEALGVFMSSKMSGTFDTARVAAEMVLREMPGIRIEVLDSGSNSMEEGFGVIAAAQAALEGGTIEGCIDAAKSTLRRTRYLFSPHTLEYLRRGGRIGGASALIGGLLQIKPILTVESGETQTFAKVRTQARALDEMARTFAADAKQLGLERVIVHYIADLELATRFATERIEPVAGASVAIIPVSPVIGLHVGPAVGLVYETKRERA